MKLIYLIPTIGLLISSCSSIPLDPQSSRVVASPNHAPKGCKYLGQVIGNQGNVLTGSFTLNRNLEEGAMNDIKNKAHRLGANYVQIVTSRAGIRSAMSGMMNGNGGAFISGNSEQTSVTNVGNAYRCNPKRIGLE